MQRNIITLYFIDLILILSPLLAGAEETLVSQGASWRYLDDGSNQGVVWQLEVMNDNSWANGKAPLGYGDNGIITTLSFGGNPQQKYITTYFRHTFNVADRLIHDKLLLRLRYDDAAIVFLNGSEVMRTNLSCCNDVNYQTAALNEITGVAESTFIEQEISGSLLMNGNNLIAVEIHQVSASDNDLIFDLELIGNGVSNTLFKDGFE